MGAEGRARATEPWRWDVSRARRVGATEGNLTAEAERGVGKGEGRGPGVCAKNIPAGGAAGGDGGEVGSDQRREVAARPSDSARSGKHVLPARGKQTRAGIGQSIVTAILPHGKRGDRPAIPAAFPLTPEQGSKNGVPSVCLSGHA